MEDDDGVVDCEPVCDSVVPWLRVADGVAAALSVCVCDSVRVIAWLRVCEGEKEGVPESEAVVLCVLACERV